MVLANKILLLFVVQIDICIIVYGSKWLLTQKRTQQILNLFLNIIFIWLFQIFKKPNKPPKPKTFCVYYLYYMLAYKLNTSVG